MVYRKGAFDHFDSILCVGDHQIKEIRAWEALQGLPPKQLFKHGHPSLDALMNAAKENPAPPVSDDMHLNILLAPSWGPLGLMETRGEEVVQTILDAGHLVRVRPTRFRLARHRQVRILAAHQIQIVRERGLPE